MLESIIGNLLSKDWLVVVICALLSIFLADFVFKDTFIESKFSGNNFTLVLFIIIYMLAKLFLYLLNKNKRNEEIIKQILEDNKYQFDGLIIRLLENDNDFTDATFVDKDHNLNRDDFKKIFEVKKVVEDNEEYSDARLKKKYYKIIKRMDAQKELDSYLG